jgi:hypothetical protein
VRAGAPFIGKLQLGDRCESLSFLSLSRRMDGKDRAGRVTDHLFSHASNEDVRETGSSVGAHDNEIYAFLTG